GRRRPSPVSRGGAHSSGDAPPVACRLTMRCSLTRRRRSTCRALQPSGFGRWVVVSPDPEEGPAPILNSSIHFKTALTYEAAHTMWTSDRERGFWRPTITGGLVEPWLKLWTDARTVSWWLPKFEPPDRLVLEMDDEAGHSWGIVRLERIR